MKKKTVGAIATDLLQKAPESRDPIEIQREVQKDYIKNLEEAVKSNIKNTDDDFFVSVITKREKLMENVLRNYFFCTSACPTPDYNQSVFQYNAKNADLTYLWTIPDEETCAMFEQNALKIVPEERELLGFILDFKSGNLLRIARRLNGENLVTGITLEGN